jgi:hypothetical protein
MVNVAPPAYLPPARNPILSGGRPFVLSINRSTASDPPSASTVRAGSTASSFESFTGTPAISIGTLSSRGPPGPRTMPPRARPISSGLSLKN